MLHAKEKKEQRKLRQTEDAGNATKPEAGDARRKWLCEKFGKSYTIPSAYQAIAMYLYREEIKRLTSISDRTKA